MPNLPIILALHLILLAYAAAQIPVEGLTTFGTAVKGGQLTNDEQIVFEFNHTDGGVVTEQWFTGGGARWEDIVVKIYIDGEATPSLEYELFLGHAIGYNENQYSPWATKRLGKIGNNGGLFNTFRIPFKSSIKVTLTGAEAKANVFWYIIRGLTGVPVVLGDLQLPKTARLQIFKNVNVSLKPLEFLPLAQVEGGGGAVFLSFIQAGSTDFNYLEACIRAFIDGAKYPMFLSSGTEDYFSSCFYFNTGVYHTPNAGLTHFDKSNSRFSAYKFFEDGPLVFSKSIDLRWRAGEDNSCPSKWGVAPPEPEHVPVGLAETVATTYTWVYVW